MIKCKCEFCGKIYYKSPSRVKGHKHLFCSKKCKSSAYNKTLNPEHYQEMRDTTNSAKNLSAWAKEANKIPRTEEMKEKISKGMMKHWDQVYQTNNIEREEISFNLDGKELITRKNSDPYIIYRTKRIHRLIAEQKLGRPLKKGEVVHHIDGDKTNNDPSNLMIFASQAEHMKYHKGEKK